MDLNKHYPIDALKESGFIRKRCRICGKYFWTLNENRGVCADHEKYSFINNPVGRRISYKNVWRDFSKFLEKRGYIPIKRYPVVARWRDDLEFVIASIADFQPWVVEGYIDPPSEKLTVPQFCLRFNDLGNVGFTGRHYTGFVMIGQHAFVPPEKYNINEYFKDLLEWFLNLKIRINEFVFHEDKWEGGGNAGTSIEFFIRGLEIANQVYMQYKVVNGVWIDLQKLKVLDMGMGQERISWLLNGTSTSYDITFPNTIRFLKDNLKEEINWELAQKITPYMSQFDYEKKSLKEFIQELNKRFDINIKDTVLTLGAIYAIPDHVRTLLISISDGALPSNIGGGYNLRLVLRRMYDFLSKYTQIEDIEKVFEKVLEDWYEKELKENLPEIIDIVNYEIKRYEETKRKARKILKEINITKLDSRKLFELYTSHGITIELIKEVYPEYEPPRDFYKYLEGHRKISKVTKTAKELDVDVRRLPETYKVFYEDWKMYKYSAKFLKSIRNYLIFDRTIFYPLKGGQKYDKGWIFNLELLQELDKDFVIENLNIPNYVLKEILKHVKGCKRDPNLLKKSHVFINEVYEKEKVILHKADRIPDWKNNTEVLMIIDKDRRYSLARHHTATHILTGVLRKRYGKHVWQAGAEKDENKARLDITHHKLPSKEEILEIEREVNKVILAMLPIKKFTMKRNEAEQRYGFIIYQGGAIPEVNLRIVEIEGIDVEACSGTHVDNTIEVGPFKIIKVERIADGMIRFEFVAGKKAIELTQKNDQIINNLEKIFNTNREHLIKVAEKAIKEREEYQKKYTRLLEELITGNVKDKRLFIKLETVSIKELIPIIMKIQKTIDELYIETKDGILSSEPQKDSKKVGKFYLRFK
ncbi:MAG TPA: glycine--tRNA ligase subunit alpha [Candidatus Nanopusillus sp.]|nr:glycine--tRNA ligase subunit alpha [Candidatus Nanopusillus sp.]